jgi:hypothetical protein
VPHRRLDEAEGRSVLRLADSRIANRFSKAAGRLYCPVFNLRDISLAHPQQAGGGFLLELSLPEGTQNFRPSQS